MELSPSTSDESEEAWPFLGQRRDRTLICMEGVQACIAQDQAWVFHATTLSGINSCQRAAAQGK